MGDIAAGRQRRLGRIPALFTTLTAPVFKWERLIWLIRQWVGPPEAIEGKSSDGGRRRFFTEANRYPEIVQWYVTLKLELVLMLASRIPPVSIDDSFITGGWGEGGVAHIHSVLWAASSPRMGVVSEDEKARGACSRVDLLLEPDVVRQLAD